MTGPDAYAAKVGDWAVSAACASVDPELFFPGPGTSTGLLAKQVCNRCPVLEECRDYSVRLPWLTGIWGGFSEKERQEWRRAWRPR